MSNQPKRLYRSRDERMIAGVCGGLGEFLSTDPTIVRLIAVLITFFWPFTILAYLILILVVPEEPQIPTAGHETPPESTEEGNVS